MKNHYNEMKLNFDRILSMYDDVSETALADAIRSVVDKSNTVYMFRRLNDDEPDTALVTWVKSNAVASYDKVSIVSLTEIENIVAASGEPIYRVDLDEINRASFLQQYKIPIRGLNDTNATTGLYDFYTQDPLYVDDKAYEQHDFIFCNDDEALLVSFVAIFAFTFFDHDEVKKDYSNRVELRFDYRFDIHNKVSDANYSNVIRNIIDKSNIVYMFRQLSNYGEPDTALAAWVKTNAVASYDLICLKSSTETINILAESEEPIYRIDLDGATRENFLQKYKIQITALKSSNMITGLYDFFIKDPLFIDDITYDEYDFIFCDNEKALLMSFTHDFDFTIFHHGKITLKDSNKELELRFNNYLDIPHEFGLEDFPNLIRNIIDKSNIVYMFRKFSDGEPDTVLATWVKSNAVDSYDKISLTSSIGTRIVAEPEEPIYRLDLNGAVRDGFLQKYKMPISALRNSNLRDDIYDFLIKDPLFIDDITYAQYDFIFCDNENVLLSSFTHLFHFENFHVCPYFSF